MSSVQHVDFETLSDYVDGVLPAEESAVVERHLSVCAACSSEHATLRSVLQSTAALPRSVLPPDDLWTDLARALEARKFVELPSAGGEAEGGRRPLGAAWRRGTIQVAAAVALVVASSATTAIVLRESGRETVVARPIAPREKRDGGVPRVVLPASFQQAEKEYNRTIGELQLAVDTQRSRLSPETIRTVDHSLAVVDSAIAEARAALIADPNNTMLVDLLSASYRRKLELLRRTSELGSRI